MQAIITIVMIKQESRLKSKVKNLNNLLYFLTPLEETVFVITTRNFI